MKFGSRAFPTIYLSKNSKFKAESVTVLSVSETHYHLVQTDVRYSSWALSLMTETFHGYVIVVMVCNSQIYPAPEDKWIILPMPTHQQEKLQLYTKIQTVLTPRIRSWNAGRQSQKILKKFVSVLAPPDIHIVSQPTLVHPNLHWSLST